MSSTDQETDHRINDDKVADSTSHNPGADVIVNGDMSWTESSRVQDSAPAYEAPSYSNDSPSTSFE